jgi:hypothetical protein
VNCYKVVYETGNGYHCSCCREADQDEEILQEPLQAVLEWCVDQGYYVNREGTEGVCKSDWEAQEIWQLDDLETDDWKELPKADWKKELDRLEEARYNELLPLGQKAKQEYRDKEEAESKKNRYEMYLRLKKEFEHGHN